MGLREVQDRTDRDEAGRVDGFVRHVIVTLDVVEGDCCGDAGLLVEIGQVALEIGVIEDPAQAALEMDVIDDVKADERAEKAPVGFDDAITEEVAA